MLGLMQHDELTVDEFLAYAERWHGRTQVVSHYIDGAIERIDYATVAAHARRVSAALLAWGMRQGDRVATLAANTARHLECWYGITGIGGVCHAINSRISEDQLGYIIDHAQDRLIFVEAQFLPLLQAVENQLGSVERIIVLGSCLEMPAALLERIEPLADFVGRGGGSSSWGGFDEQSACGLCYTSGTTGSPKGVLYSHRSNYLHTLLALQPDLLGLSAADVIMPVVPLFHANAWGLVYAGPAVGAKLVLPGSRLDAESLFELMESEGVTFAAAVPTVWLAFLDHLRASHRRPRALQRVVVGGAAVPASLVSVFEEEYGIEVAHLWGMTELSPIGSANRRARLPVGMSREQQIAWRLKQGRCPVGVDLEVKDDAGRPVAHDGQTRGHLVVHGRTVVSAYFRRDEANIVDEQGYFDTGEVATIDEHGCLQLIDRDADLIRSGSEWIRCADVESLMVSHPKVAAAAVIAMPDRKWGERPLLVVELVAGERVEGDELLRHLQGRIPRWWLPEVVKVIEQMPVTPTGTLDKEILRRRLSAREMP